MPKRFYTVKETAKILGVSTNTVYKYLDEGSLKGKRLKNRGRFKVPFPELAPYLGGETSTEVSEETPVVKQEDQKAKGKSTAFGLLFVPSLIGIFLLLLLWNFSQGAIASQSSLTRDIGNAVLGYSSRTFSGFGSLVSRFLPEAQQFAKGTQPPNETLSTPSTQIVSEEKTLDLSYKIENTEGRTNELYADAQVLASSTQRLLSKSRTLTSAELNNAIEEMSQLLGSLSDSSDKKTIFAEINWLSENWDFTGIEALKRAASNAGDLLVSLQRQSLAAFTRPEIVDLNNLVVEADLLPELVGDPSDLPSEKTLYGNIKGVGTLAQTIDAKVGEIDKILESWDNLNISEKEYTVKSILSDTLSINVLPKVDEVVFSGLRGPKDESELKNSLLSVKGVLMANKTHLAQKAGETVVGTWPEWDGAAYKILIINPSKKDSQEVAYKYYLPSDLKRGDVEQTDAGLTLSFDSQKNQYFMEVNLPLPAGEAKTLGLKTNNIWKTEAKAQKTGGQEISEALETTTANRQNKVLGTENNKPFSSLTALREKVAGLRAQIPREKVAALGLIIFLSGLTALIVYLMTFIRWNKKSVQTVSVEVQSADVESILIPKFSTKKETIKKESSWLTIKFRAIVSAILAIPALIISFFLKVLSTVKTFTTSVITGLARFISSVITSILRAFRATTQAILTFAAKTISAARKTVVTIGNGFLKIPVAILTFFLKVISSIRTLLVTLSTGFYKLVASIIAFVGLGVAAVVKGSIVFVSNLISAVTAFFTGIGSAITKTTHSVKTGIPAILSSIGTFFLRIITSVKKLVIGVTTSLLQAVKATINAVVVFSKNLISALVKAVVSIGSGVLAVLTSTKNFFLKLITAVTGGVAAVAIAFKKALLAVIQAITTFVTNVVSAISAFVGKIVSSTVTFVAKIISLVTRALISTITFFLKVLYSITKTLALIIKKVLKVSVSITKFADSTLGQLNFGAPTARKPRRGLRVATVLLLIGLAAALISATAALVIAAQVERSQQAVLKEEEVTSSPEPVKEIPVKKVTIKETETGWLRVRSTPSGNEIGKVYPGETFDLLDEASGWYLLELSDGARGWVFARYASLE
ncbi:SH3 domain-containing protein [Candidatus Woesebacteria bacterium]|nr:SH3 domain-containing protein [Candidatus Woesebacteria bacterium]